MRCPICRTNGKIWVNQYQYNDQFVKIISAEFVKYVAWNNNFSYIQFWCFKYWSCFYEFCYIFQLTSISELYICIFDVDSFLFLRKTFNGAPYDFYYYYYSDLSPMHISRIRLAQLCADFFTSGQCLMRNNNFKPLKYVTFFSYLMLMDSIQSSEY